MVAYQHGNIKPVPVAPIARELGLAVHKGKMDPGIAGLLCHRDGVYTIGVNRHLPMKLQRYVVPHECADFVLHRSFLQASRHHWIRDDVFFRSPFIPIEVEEEAHQWAMDVLLPLPLLEAELEDVGSLDDKAMTALADRFGVALSRLQARLIPMGVIGSVSA